MCYCGNAYLSQPALNNHQKIKHQNSQNNTFDGVDLFIKKRGRPKKGVK